MPNPVVRRIRPLSWLGNVPKVGGTDRRLFPSSRTSSEDSPRPSLLRSLYRCPFWLLASSWTFVNVPAHEIHTKVGYMLVSLWTRGFAPNNRRNPANLPEGDLAITPKGPSKLGRWQEREEEGPEGYILMVPLGPRGWSCARLGGPWWR
jgi:hypothetical protein